MYSKIISILTLVVIISFASCVKARDYVCSDDGYVKVDFSMPFGSGTQSKDYLLVDECIIINYNDTKNIVKNQLGTPDFVGTTLEGYEIWRYLDKKVEIYFKNKYVTGWQEINFRP